MGLGTGKYCKYCNVQIYMDDRNADEYNEICGKCNAMKKILKDLQGVEDEDLTYKDIAEVSNKDDILGAIPYLDWNNIEIEKE